MTQQRMKVTDYALQGWCRMPASVKTWLRHWIWLAIRESEDWNGRQAACAELMESGAYDYDWLTGHLMGCSEEDVMRMLLEVRVAKRLLRTLALHPEKPTKGGMVKRTQDRLKDELESFQSLCLKVELIDY